MESAASDGVMRSVVVGLDGSPPSAHALDWAVSVLAPLRTVHAVSAVSPAGELAVSAFQVDSSRAVAARRREIEAWTASTRAVGTEVQIHVVEDSEAAALHLVADEVAADGIVVGIKGHARRLPRTVGGTVRTLIDQAHRPIVIVPEGAEAQLSGSVVAGVGDAGRISHALRWAAAFAARHDLSLSLIRAGSNRALFSVDGLLQLIAYFLDRDMVRTWALEDLERLADEIRGSTDADLQVSWSAPGSARHPRIVEASADASLLVLETRPDAHAGTASWVRDAIKQAPCPVMLFPVNDVTRGERGRRFRPNPSRRSMSPIVPV